MKKQYLLGFMLLVLIMGTAKAIEISPGEIYTGNCTTDCIDDTYNITCSLCEECNETVNETCGVCEINRTLSWDETYKNNDGICDIEFYCEDFNISKIGYVNFPVDINIKNDHNGTIFTKITIYDRNGNVMNEETNVLNSNSISDITFPHEFACPAELTTDINIDTCTPYLREFFSGADDDRLLQIFTGSTLCQEELSSCIGQTQSCFEDRQYQKVRFATCDEQRSNMDIQIAELKFDMNDPNGKRALDVKAAESQFGFYASAWSTAFFLLLAIFGIWFFVSWYKENSFSGGVPG